MSSSFNRSGTALYHLHHHHGSIETRPFQALRSDRVSVLVSVCSSSGVVCDDGAPLWSCFCVAEVDSFRGCVSSWSKRSVFFCGKFEILLVGEFFVVVLPSVGGTGID